MNNKSSIFEFISKMKSSGEASSRIASEVSNYLEFKARDYLTPYNGQFELTPYCNLDCKMCYVHLNSIQTGSNQLLSVETWKALMSQAIDNGMIKARISGGECLTYSGFEEIYLFLKLRGIRVSVLTNGLLLDQEKIDFFKTYIPEKIQISLYGSSDDVYENVTGKRAFSIVLNNIKNAKKEQLPVSIAITPSKYNKEDLKNIIDLVEELDLNYDINSNIFQPRLETGRAHDNHDIDLDSYIDLYKYRYKLKNKVEPIPNDNPISINCVPGYECTGIKCGAGRSKFAVNWKGIMNPCSQLTNINAYPLKDGFAEAWKQLTDYCSILPRYKKCMQCPYSKLCNVCFAANQQMGSMYEIHDIWCERTRKKIQHGLVVYDSNEDFD